MFSVLEKNPKFHIETKQTTYEQSNPKNTARDVILDLKTYDEAF